MDLLANVILGLETAATPVNLFYCFVGVFVGMFVGVLPGIGPLTAISMLLPLTYHFDPTTALIMLGGIWYGTAYGGSTAAILLNIPGTTSSAVACLDGYPMAQQGRGGVALLMTTVASFIGASIAIIILMAFAPTIASYALQFGSADYFSLMVLGLVAASAMSEGSAAKGLAMVVIGIILGTIGVDIYSGTSRFHFGLLELANGVSMAALAMGLFGVAEVIFSLRSAKRKTIDRSTVTFRAMKPTSDDLRRSWFPILRGTGLGSFFGTLPGTGPSIASFMAYAFEKRIAKEPKRFGKGAIEGVVAPEAANNAADQTAFIPTLALGIPGSATMALMLGALTINGIAPGPTLMTNHPQLFWGLIMSFWIGNLILLVLNIPMIGLWVRLLLVPYNLLYPAILVFICIGTYSINNSSFDVMVVAGFGLLGCIMRALSFPAAPLLLGFVLGPLMEEHFRRAMLLSRGDFMTFLDRPISVTVLIISAVILVWGVSSSFRANKKEEPAVQSG